MDRATVLGRLARLVAASDPRQRLAVRLCEAARALVDGRGSSININSDDSGSRTVLAATDDAAAQLENLQDVLGEGPCRQAYRTNQPVVTDLRDVASKRWPAFTRAAVQIVGDAVIYCFPMRPVGHPFGVLSIYTSAALTDPADILQFLADAVGAALLQDSAMYELEGVLAGRAVIHQATGMVVVQLRLSPDDALAILRAHAFAHGTTVREIAEQVVSRRLDFRENT